MTKILHIGLQNDVPSVEPLVKGGEPGRLPLRGPLQVATRVKDREVQLLIDECETMLSCLRGARMASGTRRIRPNELSSKLLDDLHRNLVFLAVLAELKV